MARPLGASRPDALVLRILSAAVLAPLAVFGAWLGGPLLAAVTILVAAGMGWEWGRLTDGGHGLRPSGMLVAATELIATGLAALGWPLGGIAVLLAGAAGRLFWPTGQAGANVWASVGTLWIGIACMALLWLSADPLA